MSSKRLNFALEDPSVAPVTTAVATVLSPPSVKIASPVTLEQPLPKRAMSDEKVFFNLQPAAVPIVEAAPPALALVAESAPVHLSSDEVPPEIRSFGSSLSMLQAAFGSVEGLSNVSLGSLSLDGSNSSSSQMTVPDITIAAMQPSPPVLTAPTAPSVGPAMAPRSGVQERLRKMLKARMAAKRDDESSGIPKSPSQSSLTSPRVEQLAWSPVVAGAPVPDDTLGSVSDLSLMLGDKLGKVSLSFRDEDFAMLDEAKLILETRERRIDALKLDIQQLHETVASKSPARRKGSAGSVDEENLVNKAPSLIPRPGTRSRPVRVLTRK
jgi:hypothetical protein